MGQWKDKKTGKWTAKFQFNNGTHRKKGFRTRNKAREWETTERERLKKLAHQSGSLHFGDLADEYISHCQARMQRNTWRQKHFVYKSFLVFVEGDRPVEEITTKQIADYLKNRALKEGNKAANRDLKEIKALYNWGLKQEILDIKNPCNKIDDFPEAPYIPYVPPPEDVDKVRMAADPHERDFIEVIYHAIARKIEAKRLTWSDVNFEQRWVRLYTRKRRGGQLEPVYKPMNKTLYRTLYTRWKRRDKTDVHVFQFDQDRLDHLMKELCKKAGVKHFGFHAIRHHVASVINDSRKASMKQIQGLLGHKRQSTTEEYLHVIGSALYDAAGILDDEGERERKKIKVVPQVVPRGS